MFTLDDVGNADRFVATYGDDVRYVPQFKKWLVWNGTHWAISIGEHYSMAASLVRNLHDEAKNYLIQGDMNAHKEITRHIQRSAGRIDTLLKIASSHEEIRVSPEWLDSDRNYLNALNLTLDLSDGSIRAHTPADLLTKVVKAPYFPGTPRPLWEAFLAQVQPDPEMREYIKRLAGYTLLGGMQERILVFLHGIGKNGKSVFVETLRSVLGDYAIGTPVTTFLEKRSETGNNDLARLRGARMVAASEFEEGAKANIALLKQVTGDERITARPLYGEYFDFPFEGTIWISTNHMPFVGVQAAVWDRIKIVEFPVRLQDHEVDVNIKSKLATEATGILAWAVEGAQAYMAYGFEEPASIAEVAQRTRGEQDLLRPFLEDACDIDVSHTSTSGEVYRAYTWWCAQNGERPMTQRTFGVRLSDHGFVSNRTSKVRYWLGFRLKAGVNA